ncbi:hypothetical protein GLOTRDRAFT_97182 [Gloeophyllum trabeum ATCC 11539]|uniref:CCHC-type domain-containing protein n=1 Tax=Gloeophyllum trabeum (strain ATCC 11539 / FP-39264 / Madison 617) TaxID=670483 RepID=S7R716_GLOTA|nr:uncharacterized protein GLOTRDRAFT_97182 [Gloeophyllum trabeum ATCC 11539]EPQ50180.1 hypothetical protein GLOTRDRAFT_97182 [Gloeophyllum trabeum ATCC 11539]
MTGVTQQPVVGGPIPDTLPANAQMPQQWEGAQAQTGISRRDAMMQPTSASQWAVNQPQWRGGHPYMMNPALNQREVPPHMNMQHPSPQRINEMAPGSRVGVLHPANWTAATMDGASSAPVGYVAENGQFYRLGSSPGHIRPKEEPLSQGMQQALPLPTQPQSMGYSQGVMHDNRYMHADPNYAQWQRIYAEMQNQQPQGVDNRRMAQGGGMPGGTPGGDPDDDPLRGGNNPHGNHPRGHPSFPAGGGGGGGGGGPGGGGGGGGGNPHGNGGNGGRDNGREPVDRRRVRMADGGDPGGGESPDPNGDGSFRGPQDNRPGRQRQQTPYNDYEDKMMIRLRRIIADRRRRALPANPSLKNLKRPAPRTYSGKADIVEFEEWLHCVLDEYDVIGLGMASENGQQVARLSLFLTGDANQWYRKVVMDVDREVANWEFPDLIVEMFRRFMYTSTPREANDRYDAIKYSSRGVKKMKDEMEYWAQRRVQPPSDYDFRRSVFNRLPERLKYEVSVTKGVTPETDTLDSMIEKIEEVERGYTYHGLSLVVKPDSKGRVPHGQIPRRHPQRSTQPQPDRNAPRKDIPSNQHSAQPVQDNARSAPARNPGNNRPYFNRGQSRPPQRPAPPRRSMGPRPLPPARVQGAPSDNKCFNCGSPGHYANNCPRKGEKMRAMEDNPLEDELEAHTVHELDNDDPADELQAIGEETNQDNYDPDSYEGSQYESPEDEDDHFGHMRDGFSDDEPDHAAGVVSDDDDDYPVTQARFYAMTEFEETLSPDEFLTGEVRDNRNFLTGSMESDSDYYSASSRSDTGFPAPFQDGDTRSVDSDGPAQTVWGQERHVPSGTASSSHTQEQLTLNAMSTWHVLPNWSKIINSYARNSTVFDLRLH